MSVLNQLKAKAKRRPKPKELTINANYVGALANDVIALTWGLKNNDRTIFIVKDGILNGELRLMGIPVRVVGKEAVR